MKQFKEAKDAALKVLSTDENSAEAHRVMGHVHMAAEEYDQAVHSFKKVTASSWKCLLTNIFEANIYFSLLCILHILTYTSTTHPNAQMTI